MSALHATADILTELNAHRQVTQSCCIVDLESVSIVLPSLHDFAQRHLSLL